MARRSLSRFQRTSRPNRSWSAFMATAPVSVAAASKVLIGGFTLSNPNIDETILRTVGSFSIRTDNNNGSEFQIGAFGMIRATDAAVAAGVASIPGPITDRGDDGWFTYAPFSYSSLLHTAVGFTMNESHTVQLDSKAKRRMEEGTQIALVVENAHATHGFTIVLQIRMLGMVSGT